MIGSLVAALVSAFAPLPAQIAVLGALVSILGGLFVSYLAQEEDRDRRRTEAIERLAVPLALATEDDLYPHYLAYCWALTDLAAQTDPVLREIAALKLASVNGPIGLIAAGTVVFAGTETWRGVYEQLLAGATLREYRSVAWVRSTDYWQDAPGRQSMRANFEAAHRGVLIERIAVLPDALWPDERALPAEAVRPWFKEQAGRRRPEGGPPLPHLLPLRPPRPAGRPLRGADQVRCADAFPPLPERAHDRPRLAGLRRRPILRGPPRRPVRDRGPRAGGGAVRPAHGRGTRRSAL
jgi:hypothetical protein